MNSLKELKIDSIIMAVKSFNNGNITKSKLNQQLKMIERKYDKRRQEYSCKRCNEGLLLFEMGYCSGCLKELKIKHGGKENAEDK